MRSLSKIGHALAGKMLFGTHPMAPALQKIAQRLLHGPRDAMFQIRYGPAAGGYFSCLTSHKYFFVREDYESDLVGPIESIVRASDIVFDIGAHFGYWVIVLSRLCGVTGKVFAFEPWSENRARLAHNIVLNEIRNVEIIPVAVSDSVGLLRISEEGSMSKVGGGVEMQATTLDFFCESHPLPDLIMIDVEGHAVEVLRGAAGILNSRPIPIICEIHNQREKCAFEQIAFDGHRKVKNLGKVSGFPYRALLE